MNVVVCTIAGFRCAFPLSAVRGFVARDQVDERPQGYFWDGILWYHVAPVWPYPVQSDIILLLATDVLPIAWPVDQGEGVMTLNESAVYPLPHGWQIDRQPWLVGVAFSDTCAIYLVNVDHIAARLHAHWVAVHD